MKKVILVLAVLAVCLSSIVFAEGPVITPVEYKPGERLWFARYGQAQVEYTLSGTHQITGNQDVYVEKIKDFLPVAFITHKVNVLIFPEYSMSLTEERRDTLITYMKTFINDQDRIIIAGTYYDVQTQKEMLVTVLPDGRVEYTEVRREGKSTDVLFLFNTKFGRFLTLVDEEMLSGGCNYSVRDLSNKGKIDMMVHLSYNPASPDFMLEASDISLRHPLFISLTNAKNASANGYDYAHGYTSVFGSINRAYLSAINTSTPEFFTLKKDNKKERKPEYGTMLSVMEPEVQKLLLYDVNLRVIRPPYINNAPDQGYPTIKNLQEIGF